MHGAREQSLYLFPSFFRAVAIYFFCNAVCFKCLGEICGENADFFTNSLSLNCAIVYSKCTLGRIAQLVEHLFYTQAVIGSNPFAPNPNTDQTSVEVIQFICGSSSIG